jgi:ADP-heptose:LPS heptosyltransferase
VAGRLASRLWTLAQLLKPATWFRPVAAQPPRRILVLHHLLLGDTLMLTPLLAKLRAAYPAAEICLSCPRAFLPLYAAQPFGVIALPFDPREVSTLADLARRGPWDHCLIPAENRYTLLARALGARRIIGFGGDRPSWKNWLLDQVASFPSAPACFGDFVASELVAGDPPRPFSPPHWPWAEAAPFSRPQGAYVVLHLGASSPLKYWPSARWMALAEWFALQGFEVVWSAGAKETHLVNEVDPAGRFTTLAGKLDLLQLAKLLTEAVLMVCPDTGIAHLGRLTGTPTVALFGPGSPAICGAGDYWQDSPFAALSAEIPCRDQTTTFRRHAPWIRRCARSHGGSAGQCARALCMEGISLQAVQAAARTLLADPAGLPQVQG